MILGDFNGDGMLDYAYREYNDTLLNYPSSSLAIVFGNGNGTFQTGISIPTNNNASGQVVVADFNGDGRTDIAAANFDLNIYLGGQLSGLEITQNHIGPLTAGQTKIYQVSERIRSSPAPREQLP